MIIERKSPFTGEINTMDISVTEGQLAAWESGMTIQHVMPELSPDEREFIMTGITPAEWEQLFGVN